MIRRTSDPTWDYNCIAHAAGEDDRWWWPDPTGGAYWPNGVACEVTLEAFEEAYATIGYESCADGDFEPGFEKIVLYAKGGSPTHAARQLVAGTSAGNWTSKLGREIDVEHDSPHALVKEHPALQNEYGDPLRYLRRRIT